MSSKKEKVYAIILEEGGWKLRVVTIRDSSLIIARGNGEECHSVRGEHRVVIERLETSGLECKDQVSAKLLDQLGKKTDVDIMPSMICINWLGNDVEKTAVICFSDQMQRDIWLRDIQDAVTPSISLDNEVTLLRDELNNAKNDLVQKLAESSQHLSQQSVFGFPSNVVVDPVFETGYDSIQSPPPTVLYTSPAPLYNSVVPTPIAPPSPLRRIPLQTPGSSLQTPTTYVDNSPSRPHQNLLTGSILQQLQQLEHQTQNNISTLQSLKGRFDNTIADTASWRLDKRLQSTDHCSAAMHLVTQYT